MASSVSITSKALVHVCAHPSNGTISRQCYMDLISNQDTFHCKFRTSAHLLDTGKKIKVYLFLDASHVESIRVCDEEKAIPPSVMTTFIKQASSTSSDDIVRIRFVLKGRAPLVTPNSLLQKRADSYDDIESLLRIGQCQTFEVYISSSALNRQRLSDLTKALVECRLRPAPEGVLNNLYAKLGSKVVTHIDELWSSHQPESPPPYDHSTALGASNDEPTVQSDSRSSSSPRAHGKRRLASPDSQQTPLKRQLLVEKAAPEPWELAFAAQGAQIAALCAELQTLREEMQQFRRASMIDAGTQTDLLVEVETKPGSSLDYASSSQASTVENTIEDRLLMVEDSILDEQKQRALVDEKLDHTDKQIRHELEIECFGLQSAVENLESRVDDLEDGLQDDLRQEFKENIDAKALDLQARLEEFIEHRLEDVEEVVKHDVRMAFENASCKFKIDLGWSE
ncbi:hypothetical protein KCU78_g4141, partial [Aureobasidium melanogenum]